MAGVVSVNFWSRAIHNSLQDRENTGRLRSLPPASPRRIPGDLVLDLNSNDYLDLRRHPLVKKAAVEYIEKFGLGEGASRLLAGHSEIHHHMEIRLAQGHGTESALLLNNGYSGNFGLVSALGKQADMILMDKYIHASIVDGVLGAKKPFQRYRHLDMGHLEEKLKSLVVPENCLVITETLFSMDGDFAPLEALFSLQKKYGFMLFLDEAHSLGGYPEISHYIRKHWNENILVLGTFGKALGSFGAFVCGSTALMQFAVNYSRSFIFSTALPGHLVASAGRALDILAAEPERVRELHRLNHLVRSRLSQLGFPSQHSHSHIIPIVLGSESSVLQASRELSGEGVACYPIRPPTVPVGAARLRLSLKYGMQDSQLEPLFACLKKISRAGASNK